MLAFLVAVLFVNAKNTDKFFIENGFDNSESVDLIGR